MSESSRLEDLQALYGAKIDRLSRQLDEAKKDYDSVVRTLELLAVASGKSQPINGIGVEASEVEGKPLKEALLYIARKCDGILKVSPARKVLVEAEVVRNGQIGSNRISTTLQEMSEFERVRRGQYRLIDEAPENEESDSGEREGKASRKPWPAVIPWFSYTAEIIATAPEIPGIFAVLDSQDKWIHIGSSKNIRLHLRELFDGLTIEGLEIAQLGGRKFSFFGINDIQRRKDRRDELISMYRPPVSPVN